MNPYHFLGSGRIFQVQEVCCDLTTSTVVFVFSLNIVFLCPESEPWVPLPNTDTQQSRKTNYTLNKHHPGDVGRWLSYTSTS